ncbi:MAG: hypothetical protein ACTSSJ_01780 [Candidatus Odinarchaeia archaeon]
MKFIRHKKEEDKTEIKICPICGSSHLKYASFLSGWYTPEQYICENCGYSGPLILEIELSKEKMDAFKEYLDFKDESPYQDN